MEMQAPPGRPAVPWAAAEVGLVFLLGMAADVLAHGLLEALGWFSWYYGDAFVEAARAAPAGGLAAARMRLWAHAAAGPLKVVLAVALLRRTANVSLAELGLTARHLGRNVLLGLLLAAALTPGAYGLNWLMVALIRDLGGSEEAHPFTQIGQAGLTPAEWGLLLFAALVAAPVWEELFYRGILQRWVIDRQPAGGWGALAAAATWAVMIRGQGLLGGPVGVADLLPLLFLLPLAAAYPVVARRSAVWAGVFASAVLFAWVHVGTWPSPVPLVLLALGLGWLYQRTGSLAGPIVLHAAFNAVPCAMLLWQA